MDTDIPEIVFELREMFDIYERALVTNNVELLDNLFKDDARTIRFGGTETLFGHEQIKAFRSGRSPTGLERRLGTTVITTYGRDFGVASTLFYRDNSPRKIGRQMQTWVRFAEGWRVVAAHVSFINDEP